MISSSWLKIADATVANEEELRIKVSKILKSEVILGFDTPGPYEYTFVPGGHSDVTEDPGI